MVKERKLAVPNTTIFIAQLSEETRNIIRKDLEQHARENGYHLDWDWEAKDYVGMTRRFCDIDEIYKDTKLVFCEPGIDIQEYEISLQRNITIKLPDDDIDALCKKAAKAELTVTQFIENFVSDLIDGSRTNGSDERMYAQQWFERCWFSSPMEESFLSYLIDFDQIESAAKTWDELAYYKNKDELDEYEKEEVELLNEEIDELFNEYKELYRNPADATLEEGMKKVTAWLREREELMNGNKSPTAQEKKDDKDEGEDIMIHTLTKAERLVLEEMYPVGSRVQLEYMDDPYGKLKPGDLGTVRFIDDTGSIHVSWDCGSSLAILYKVDRCKCLMKSEQLDTLFNNLSVMPFVSIEKLKIWLEEKLRPAFPAMSFDNDRKGELEVGLHVDVFQMEKAKIGIKYQTDDKGKLYIEKCGWTQEPLGKKEVSKNVEHKR